MPSLGPNYTGCLGRAFVPTAAHQWFDEDGFKRLRRDVMRGGPPGFHLSHESGKRTVDGGFDAEVLSRYGDFFGWRRHVFLSGQV